MCPAQLGLGHMIFKEASSLAASLGDWGGSCGVWASQKTGHLEEQRTQTRLDSGTSDFQKKANSSLGQEGILQIIQEPEVLGSPGDMDRLPLLRPSEDSLSSHNASLLQAVRESLPLPRKELRGCHWQELCFGEAEI